MLEVPGYRTACSSELVKTMSDISRQGRGAVIAATKSAFGAVRVKRRWVLSLKPTETWAPWLLEWCQLRRCFPASVRAADDATGPSGTAQILLCHGIDSEKAVTACVG